MNNNIKHIPNTVGYYLSSDGKVYSIKPNGWMRRVSIYKNQYGHSYINVNTRKGRKVRSFYKVMDKVFGIPGKGVKVVSTSKTNKYNLKHLYKIPFGSNNRVHLDTKINAIIDYSTGMYSRTALGNKYGVNRMTVTKWINNAEKLIALRSIVKDGNGVPHMGTCVKKNVRMII